MAIVLIYAVPPLAIILAWLLAAALRAARFKRGTSSKSNWPYIATATIAAMTSLIGCLVGLVMSSLSGGDNFAFYFGSELGGAALGGIMGSAIGGYAASLSGKWSKLVSGIIITVLYWVLSLFISGTWLMINTLGDCFQNTACIHHRQQALPQTGIGLMVFFSLYVLGLFLAVWRSRKSPPVVRQA